MSNLDSVVVVGSDGSKPSRVAVVWALKQARQIGARAKIVRGWSLTNAPRPKSQTGGYVPPLEDFAEAVCEKLQHDVADLVAEHGAGVEIEYDAAYGAPANGLIAASKTADLLVVGARGLGGFRGLALGSVSDQCVRHSACPVVIVRTEHSAQTERTLD